MNIKKFSEIARGGFFRATIDAEEETGVFMKVADFEKRVNAVALVSEQPSIFDLRGELWMFEDDASVVEYRGKADFERVD